MDIKSIVIALLFSTVCLPCTWASIPKTFRFRHYTVDNNMPSNTVRSIIQDHKGYIWIGTEGGLCKFDGNEFLNFRTSNKNKKILMSNYINALFEDSNNNIWIGTDNGGYIYNYSSNKFKLFTCKDSEGISITGQINSITEDRNKNVWFATLSQGVCRYNLKTKKIERYDFPETANLLTQVFVDHDNSIWAINRHNPLSVYLYSKADNRFHLVRLNYQNKNDKSGFANMIEDSHHNIWLGTWDKGLQLLDKRTKDIKTVIPNNSKYKMTHIHYLAEFSPNILMIGSDDGLSIYDVQTKEYKLLLPEETDAFSLSDKFIYPIVKDREGGIWIATYYGGINYLSPNANQFESYSYSSYKNSVSGNVISRFCEDMQGNIWIGSDDGGLSKYNPHTGIFSEYKAQNGNNSLSYDNVHALCMDGNNLWIGTYTGGVNVLDTHTGKFKLYLSDKNKKNTLDDNSIYAIFNDKDKNIWVTTMTGVNRYNRKTDDFTRMKEFGFMTMDIIQDSHGNLWFATEGKGLFKYNINRNVWKNYTKGNMPYSLSCNMINDLLIDGQNRIWIATDEGLYIYNDRKDNFQPISLNIPSQSITGLAESGTSLWITTLHGLIHYYPETKKLEIYTKSDGLRSDQFIPASIVHTSIGEIFIGSVAGFNAFFPNNIKANKYIAPIVINGLEASGISIPLMDKTINLSYKENVLTFKFASLSYCTPEKNQYAYMLEGFDKTWNYVGNQNRAIYTNLPSGTYIFKVKGSNSDGVWNPKETSIRVVIHPPFYLSLPFKILYVIIILTIAVYVIISYQKRTERRHQENIRQIEIEKEEEVRNAKIQFFTMIAHEIRTPVSLIIGPMEKIMKSLSSIPANMQEDIEIIQRNSQRLLTLINQVLDFRKVEEGTIKIYYSKQNIYQLVKTVYDRFQPFAEQKEVTFTLNCENKDLIACVDAEAVTKMLSNLLTNVFKFTKDEVDIECNVQKDQNCFQINVSDNGCGIEKELQSNIFNAFYQTRQGEMKHGTGIGLSIVKTLAEAHEGSVLVNSTLNVGSCFSITLPINHAIDKETECIDDCHYTKEICKNTDTESKGKKRILIVEDNPDMLHFLESNLKEDYDILTANNGNKALKIICDKDISVIVSDWMMPEMDGIELCKAVRTDEMTSHIPFILLTAKTDNESKVKSMDNGVDQYIEKPFSLKYLKACISNILELRLMLHQKFSSMPLVPLDSIANNNADKEFLHHLNQIIEENFSNSNFSIDYLADKMNLSRSRLFAKIKILAGTTPNELIQIMRMKKAAQLLLENKYRINEICYMVGFNNPSYFSKCFQKQFGMKPQEFVQSSLYSNSNDVISKDPPTIDSLNTSSLSS